MSEKMRLDPKNDFIFQLLFGKQENKDILIDLLNAILNREGKDRIIDIESVENKKLDAERIMDKTCVLDVKAKGKDGTIYNIEMQLTDKKNMGLRTIYYWAKMFVEQLKSGGKYQDLQKTITINILNYNIFPEIEKFHTTFHIREDELSFVLNDRLEIHFIELGKFRCLRSEKNITDPLHQWLMFLDEKDKEILEVLKMSNPAIDRAEKILEWLSADEDILVTYRLREKSLHERASMIADAKEEGMKEGMKEGKLETAKTALIEGSNVDFVAKITGLPIEIIQQLKDELLKSKLERTKDVLPNFSTGSYPQTTANNSDN